VTSALLAPFGEGTPPDDAHTQPARRIVLIDPRSERRAVTRLLIGGCPALAVVGVAADLGAAVVQIRSEQADAALVEIQMPVTEGLAAIAALREGFPDLRILVCSFRDDAATREAAREAGADGFLKKPLEVSALLRLVDASGPEAGGSSPFGVSR